jgi:hypothetical protein
MKSHVLFSTTREVRAFFVVSSFCLINKNGEYGKCRKCVIIQSKLRSLAHHSVNLHMRMFISHFGMRIKLTLKYDWLIDWLILSFIHSSIFIQANIKHIHLNKKHHKNITLNKINMYKNSAWLPWITHKARRLISNGVYMTKNIIKKWLNIIFSTKHKMLPEKNRNINIYIMTINIKFKIHS